MSTERTILKRVEEAFPSYTKEAFTNFLRETYNVPKDIGKRRLEALVGYLAGQFPKTIVLEESPLDYPTIDKFDKPWRRVATPKNEFRIEKESYKRLLKTFDIVPYSKENTIPRNAHAILEVATIVMQKWWRKPVYPRRLTGDSSETLFRAELANIKPNEVLLAPMGENLSKIYIGWGTYDLWDEELPAIDLIDVSADAEWDYHNSIVDPKSVGIYWTDHRGNGWKFRTIFELRDAWIKSTKNRPEYRVKRS